MFINKYNNFKFILRFSMNITVCLAAMFIMLCAFTFAGAAEEEGVCARVRIRLSQDAVIARNAFKATLEITNGPENVQLENLTVNISITDNSNQPSNDLFGVNAPELSGISDVNGGGIIQPGSMATATWLILPTRDAAPDEPLTYYVGGEFSYKQGSSIITMPLFPAPILVKPDPLLVLDYFLVRDVYSDDPFTTEIEPAEPFPLGLMVRNNGNGTANNFRITSSQPEIIENEKGLLIDFKIIGTQVNSEPASPSLTVSLGNIDPGTTSVAKWVMTSSLQGKFIEYKATFEHVDGLGNPRLSIIDVVNIHELTHAVKVDIPSEDGKPDFLVNDTSDEDHMPDTLYNSTGPIEVVNIGQNPSVNWQMVGDHPEGTLTVTVPAGWVYIRVADPGQDQFKLKRVVRSDGREILIDENAWTTHRTIRLVGQSPYREHLLHLFDKDSTGSYTLIYEISGDDLDGDGYPANVDCNDNDNTVYPGATEICDNKDNDCNANTADGSGEVWFNQSTSCGVGVCASTGQFTCEGGVKTDTCQAGLPTQAHETSCTDGLDNDCDGAADAGDSDCTVQGTDYYCDNDGDGYYDVTKDGTCEGANCQPQGCQTVKGNDCDDSDNTIYPGARELCDGKINDCNSSSPDGSGEDVYGTACDGDDEDTCAEGIWTCTGGEWACTDTSGMSTEICGDDIDNDCDGAIDCCDADCGSACIPSRPSLSMTENLQGTLGCTVTMPVTYTGEGNNIAVTTFSIDYDQMCLEFDSTDTDQDGIPDAITFNVPLAYTAGATFSSIDTDGEIDIVIADMSAPLSSLNDGAIMNIKFKPICDPGLTGTITTPVKFSTNPVASFGNTSGQSVNGCLHNGSIEIHSVPKGDCNGDTKVDAGDISALVLEIFDGDGSNAENAPGGTFPGNPYGSDPNGDGKVDAGDIACTVLIIFNGPGACGG